MSRAGVLLKDHIFFGNNLMVRNVDGNFIDFHPATLRVDSYFFEQRKRIEDIISHVPAQTKFI